MKIGITLSGGGVRATVFHLGVLARLANTNLWKDLEHISTVSGGSLCIALVFEKAGKNWPTNEQFVKKCVPDIFEILTTFDLEKAYIWDIFLKPWRLLQGRAHLIGMLIREHWGINSVVSEMPLRPRWTINSTCYETGKNWRFSAKRMGGYLAHYVSQPNNFYLADAVASSAAVPGMIGPLKISTKRYLWKRFEGGTLSKDTNPIAKTITLWDGGVYDNLGVETLYKTGVGFREDIDTLLVSDASKPLEKIKKKWVYKFPIPNSPKNFRLVDIPTDQVRSLRARDLFNVFQKYNNGGYLRIGESVNKIFKNLKTSSTNIDFSKCLKAEETINLANFDTTIRKLSIDEFYQLYRHGYETCNAVLYCKGYDSFSYYDSKNFSYLK